MSSAVFLNGKLCLHGHKTLLEDKSYQEKNASVSVASGVIPAPFLSWLLSMQLLKIPLRKMLKKINGREIEGQLYHGKKIGLPWKLCEQYMEYLQKHCIEVWIATWKGIWVSSLLHPVKFCGNGKIFTAPIPFSEERCRDLMPFLALHFQKLCITFPYSALA